jgi:hypothetical protein
MGQSINSLVSTWRDMGPVAWAGHKYGWVMPGGATLELLPWQRAALSAWWEHSAGVSTLALSNVKKTGKTTTNAVVTAWRWLCLPGEHFCCGNDLDASEGRQFAMIAEMVRLHPILSKHTRATKSQLIFESTRSTLTALPVDAAGNAGANHLTASHTEAWGIIYEAGVRAFEELTPPPGRFYGLPALRIADSYAGFLGESDTWHTLVDRGLKGERLPGDWPIFKAGGLLLFHMEGEEGRARCFRGTPEEAEAYYAEQAASLRPATFTRLHGNARTANESRFVTPEQWAACYSPDVQAWQAGDARRMALGADASTSRDLTALVGVWYNPATQKAEVLYCQVWRPERGELRGGKPTIDLDATIGAEVFRLRALGAVDSVTFDPYQLHTVSIAWQRAGIRCIEFPQTAARVEADQSLYDSIIGHNLAHFGDPVLTDHVTNAVAVETARGFRLAKEKAVKKIDAAVALSMARHTAKAKPLGVFFG